MVGAEPSFNEVHLLRTLYTLESDAVGRKKLVKILGLGEGSVRTIIKKLTAEGLIASSKKGHSLTIKGKKAVAEKLKIISRPCKFDTGGLVVGPQSLVIVTNGASSACNAVHLRDTALKAGADGAIIFSYDGSIKLPGLELDDYPRTIERLNSLNLRHGDAIIIGFASTLQKAEDGAVSAALKMIH